MVKTIEVTLSISVRNDQELLDLVLAHLPEEFDFEDRWFTAEYCRFELDRDVDESLGDDEIVVIPTVMRSDGVALWFTDERDQVVQLLGEIVGVVATHYFDANFDLVDAVADPKPARR